MNRNAIIGAVAVVAIGAGVYWFWPKEAAPPPSPEPVPVVTPPPPPADHPVPDADVSTMPLPDVDDSDATMLEAAKSLTDRSAIEQWLIPTSIVRHIVATVDNLPRKKYAERQKPIKPIPGRFAVDGPDTAPVLAAGNAARYAPFVKAVQGIDMPALAKEYFRLYPLFQRAYRDLGYPDAYFNNRLVEAIDDLLAAPRIEGPIKLTRPNVLYEYADSNLENLSAGQKIMIRMGANNADAIKVKLRELRAAVANGR